MVLIVAGVALPLLMLFFLSNYHAGQGWFYNILHVQVVIMGLAIPYRFPLAACIFLIFLGIRLIEQSRGGPPDTPENKQR